ncbi:hypothetical protein LPJ66_000630 [Kickxella alabastrina]|uniref:Uncharacterized protein n=1 Tax=Kickxella alabastrina TaxID=61397 RepID=A0ACC1IVI7_9FUNG|nr:hypothetical protein LPJ66_000630 [Kickxella alabastrina]
MFTVRQCAGRACFLRAAKATKATPTSPPRTHILAQCRSTPPSHRRFSSQTPKGSGKHDSEAAKDWDRTIQEAIEQAKKEIVGKGFTGPQTKGAPEEPPKEPNSEPKDKPNKGPSFSEKDPPKDYITTLGRVMQELPHELEGFFEHGLDGSIYSETIRFSEPRHSGMQVSGRAAYMGVARVLRIAMNAYFSDPAVTILSLRQVPVAAADEAGGDGQRGAKQFDVVVRWMFEGLPRHSVLIGGGGGDSERSRYEGEFRYCIDPETGLVAVHEVSAIHPTPPAAVFASSSGLAQWAGWLAPRGSLSLSKRHAD